MDCNNCNKLVPYIVHEGSLARMERTIQRQWITIIVLIAALIMSFVGFAIYENQFEDVYTTTEGVSQHIETDGSAIVAGIGNASYGYDNQTDG